jgi:hypothetical protein
MVSRAGRFVAAGLLGASCLAASAFAAPARLQDSTTTGEFWVEPPTLISLGFEWRITGDENRNAKVTVSFRKKGEAAWRPGLPLLRSQHEFVGDNSADRATAHEDPFQYPVPNMFAGSIFNLEPDTDYEVRLALSDPDGVKGAATKSVTVRTRKEPQPYAGGRVFHAYPIGWKGAKQEPGATGLMEAYYQGACSSDCEGSFPARVKPGDTILMHAGTYTSERTRYLNGLPHEGYNALGTLFDGTYYLTASGTADKPIVIKAAGDGEVIFDGAGAQTLFNLQAANYNYFEGITFRNANLLFLLGLKDIIGSSGFTLKHSRIYNVGRAVQDEWSGSKNVTIMDNSFIGRHDPAHLVGWNGNWPKRAAGYEMVGGPSGSEYAIKLYGQGHVVAYNYFANWHDGVDVATYGNPDGTPNEVRDRAPVSIDFYNNDFDNMGDNCIEADGGAHNIRVFRNRCYNTTGGALSAAPIAGGPVYFFRNLVYNAGTSDATKYRTASGILTWQNTFVGNVLANVPNIHFANNLLLSAGTKPLFAVTTATSYSSSDYNGFRPNDGAAPNFVWNSPPPAMPIGPKESIVKRGFSTLPEYVAGTGQDKHSLLIDYNVFTRAHAPNPDDIEKLYAPEDFDFTLVSGAAAIDAGMLLPTINDGYAGKAPDLGAYEFGQKLPSYGPRTPVPGTPIGDGSLRTLVGPPEGR